MYNLSLKAKMTIAVCVLVALLMSMLAFFMFSYFQSHYKENIAEQQTLLLAYIAEDIDSGLLFALGSLEEAAKKLQPERIGKPDDVQRFLDSMMVSKIFDNGMFLFNPEGILIAESPFLPDRRGLDFSYRDYFQKTVATEDSFISNPYNSSKTGNPAIMFTAPIFNQDGKLIAILGGSLDLMNSNNVGALADIKLGQTGYLSLYTTDRTIIVHPDKSRVLRNDTPSGVNKLFDDSIAGFEGTGETINLSGVRLLATFKRLESTNWILAANYPVSEAYAPLEEAKNYFVVGSILGIALAVSTVWFIMRHLTAPLVSFTSQIRNLNINQDSDKLIEEKLIKVNSTDEIGDLAEAFNRMTGQLLKQSSELRKSKDMLKRYEILAEGARDIILFLGSDGRIIEANHAAVLAYGYERRELLSMTIENLQAPNSKICVDVNLMTTATEGILCETVHRRKDGTVFPVEVSVQSTAMGEHQRVLLNIIRDISDRKEAEETINHLAYHDPLTDLPNRTLFLDRLNLELARVQQSKELLAVMFLDLDSFKIINDTLGHPAGDRLLQEVAKRLKRKLTTGDTIARMGGDEFTLLFPQIMNLQDAAKIADRIIDVFQKPWYIDGQEMHITASIGIAICPNDGGDAETLMKHADTAMYRAKEQSNSYQFFSPVMKEKAVQRMIMERNLRKALERNELDVYYQPQIDTKTGQITGAEALLRWQHPELGMISAADFIPLAESTGLIVPIGEWVLSKVCSQNKEWQEAGIQVNLTVNLSAHQLRSKSLIQQVVRVLRETGLEPRWLEMEITESVAMQDIDSTVELLQELRQMGIRISLDDFGTGYSSLNYLRKLPIDALKLDRSFVREIVTNHEDAAIAKTIIDLARSLNLDVIIEGVENREQADFFRQHNCYCMQGFLFSKPLPAGEFISFLKLSTFGTKI